MTKKRGILLMSCLASMFFLLRLGGCNQTTTSGQPPDGGSGTGDMTSAGGDMAGGSGDMSLPNMSCGAVGQACMLGSDCCSGTCDPTLHTCSAPCGGFAQSCTNNSSCCSGVCDPVNMACTMPPTCAATGSSCMVNTDCCGLSCVGGKCQTGCTSDGQTCTSPGQCCSGICSGGVCGVLNPGAGCKSSGNTCSVNTDCCSGLCSASKTCSTASSFCHQINDVCTKNTDCCTQNCVITAPNTLGVCQANPTSGSGGCTVAGTLCSGCGGCCSALCLPYAGGPTSVCQVASGCHVTGDLCTQTSDCCGAPGTGLPGAGEVYCNIPTGAKIGTCHKPSGCNPEGEVCHYTGTIMACGNSRNDCCNAPGSASAAVCKLDTEGIPRCYGLKNGMCIAAGGDCASSADCCSNLACVPNAMGVLQCGYMNMTCSPAGGPCTVAADCCNAGYSCVTAPGSVQGVCTAPMPPPDGGAADGGSGSDMGQCALYGQGCSVGGTACCNGVQCSAPGGMGTPCTSGQTGCTCYQIIP